MKKKGEEKKEEKDEKKGSFLISTTKILKNHDN
jgi:hypothetical protein